MSNPAEAPPPESRAASEGPPGDPPAPPPSVPLRPLTFRDPLRWLALGTRDFARAPAIGVFYGACFVVMGWVLLKVYENAPAYVLALSAGFLLMGPFLCMGLYRVSQRLEKGEKPDFGDSLLAWDTRTGQLAIFGFVLLVLEMLWGRAALVVFAVFFNTGMPSTAGVLQAVFNPENWEFIAVYLAVGGFFAGLVFATSVVSIPMILDRDTDAISASITSLQVFFSNLPVMLLWGALISLLVVAALLPWGAGLLLVGPWLGHASWHAYRGSVRWLD